MTWSESEKVQELADALDHYCDIEEHVWAVRVYFPPGGGAKQETPVHRYRVRLGVDRHEFEHCDAAMAYLQALGVCDET